ncbi:hypothetical protein ACFE04_010595 [Oxalis oulophora]
MTWEILPNGLLPDEGSNVTRMLDQERWSRAEARTEELLSCIQPSQPSEERRQAVVSYVRRLIGECLSCQVFPFGSVPLKTYLPDGDIDLTAFSENHSMKVTWANELRDLLEKEEKNECAEFRVTDVQYIQADVKIIKCLVENIVVDISFNQLGGLCTLYFLEKLDRLISSNHLFKRSIILIKAWCYYESRLLGAHYGLISTYALETLVLYIFHVFDGSFAGPLEVLYRFLEFFSKFDWDNYCVSLWGPVPISSLVDMTADPPRNDGRQLKLSKLFYDECSSLHFVSYGSQENQDLPFILKHFNIIDPLRTNNNLGRSVSKGNFFRIRSALALGAQQLSRLLHCPDENVIHELDLFFTNTWDRHGKGFRPDAPSSNACALASVNLNQMNGIENYSSRTNVKKNTSRNGSGQNLESLPNKIIGNKNGTTTSDVRNEVQSRQQFARTNSSPELSCTSIERFEAMHLNERDFKNTGGSRGYNSNGQVPLPLNLNSISSSRFVSNSQATSSRDKPSSDNCYDGGTLQNKKIKSTRDNSQGMQKSSPYMDSHSTNVHRSDENEWKKNEDESTLRHDSLENGDISNCNHKSQQSANDNNGLLPTFYPTGPPVPFVTMIPVYNFPVEPSEEEQKSDILCGDFTTHWQNLLYGRLCQNDRQMNMYPSPVVWDDPRRHAANMNLPQFMNYAPQLIPVSSMQSNSNMVNGVYHQNGDEIPRYRGGTGTYLPNPVNSKDTFWERPSNNIRFQRGNRSHDQRGEREGNWNQNSRSRFVGHGRGNQFDKAKRNNYQSNNNRQWDSSRQHDSYYNNGPSSYMPNNNNNNMGYGMHPPIVMWYQYDQNNMAHGDEAARLSEEGSSSSRVINREEDDFLEDSSPSSPHPQS